jgi:hypothetical protein
VGGISQLSSSAAVNQFEERKIMIGIRDSIELLRSRESSGNYWQNN